MNDRFKFRVWDKINDVWIEGPLLDIRQGCLAGYYMPEEAMKRRIVVEQCTGLKDKNGKLIYENDVVDFDDSECYAVIQWSEEDGCWRIITTDNTIYTFDNLYGCELTICGNIHENADLLEKINE